ncbi:hypothetical protein QFC19_001442 [Naganishia cerealis]|uniref:Uncharacterized protein n=1 Tax=Naganishia cerealis TaxID=610337 RepID=A0ACC2WGS7_9TREE|nr:hypothetical protein QFC19_001442 [Naganishia cerealis]
MLAFLFASDGERWTAEHYGVALEQAFIQEMNEEFGIREYRQIQAALSGHYLSKWKELEQDTDEAAFEQQGHTTETHNREYDRVTAQAHGIKENSQLRFELASFYWQQLVFPASVDRVPEGANRELRMQQPVFLLPDVLPIDKPIPSTPKVHTMERTVSESTMTVPISILKALRRVLKDETATFKLVEQAQAATAMALQNDECSWLFRKDILVILPTGMGKTLTWLVAAEVEERKKISIIIVPLNALLQDLATRLKGYGRKVHVCDPRMPIKLEGLSGSVLISVDRVVQPETLREIHAWEHCIVSDLS